MAAKSGQSYQAKKATSKPAFSFPQPVILQRTCTCGGSAGLTGECETCASQRLSGQKESVTQPELPADGVSMSLQRAGVGGYRFQDLAIHPRERFAIQAKLTVRPPNDRYEQEADLVAEQVMRMPDPKGTAMSKVGLPSIQRLCPECEEDLQRQPKSVEEVDEEKKKQRLQTQRLQRQVESGTEEEDEEKRKRLQMKPMSRPSTEASADLQARISSLQKGGGQPLPESERNFFEPRFGKDFSRVRIHTDARAAEMARSVNARAFTVGRDVVFGAGQYQPQSTDRQRLLAHELTHVLQQNGVQSSSKAPPRQASLHPNIQRNNNPRLRHSRNLSNASEVVISSLTSFPDTERVQCQFITPLGQGGGYGGLLERDRRRTFRHRSLDDVYMCTKDLETSPFGRHAFFRIGGDSAGNPTISLQPIDRGNDCWQGLPGRDYPSDISAQADCELTSIRLDCLKQAFAAYPVGHYCTWGPNSNTFAGHLAKSCGMRNPDPAGWAPGIDENPPPVGTFAPDKWVTLSGCETKNCTG